MTASQIKYVFDRYYAGTATEAEKQAFFEALQEAGQESDIKSLIEQQFLAGDAAMEMNEQQAQVILQSIFNVATGVEPVKATVHRVHFLRRSWFRYAAAILLIVTGIAVYYTYFSAAETHNQVVHHQPPAAGKDVQPGFNRAILTLSDGQKVQLDSAASETIHDGTLSIENNNGRLIYKTNDRVAMNTMTTPRGGQYQLTLADGTKVWLNAASSITYPTAFKTETREVAITGEAYFEVAKNAAKPFIVKTPQEDIAVLGTEFNVNAYADEPAMKTSLLEGSVKIGHAILKPGQAYVNGKVVATNIEEDLAWKNGYFKFQGADLSAVMRQVSRWYDIDVEYRRKITGTFTMEISRHTTLSNVLTILRETGEVKPAIQANKIIIQ